MIARLDQDRDVGHGEYSFSAADPAFVPVVVDAPSQDDQFTCTSKTGHTRCRAREPPDVYTGAGGLPLTNDSSMLVCAMKLNLALAWPS